MLSAARYPYMNRAFRRNPDSYDKGRVASLAVAGSALLLALLVHAGFMRHEAAPASRAMPNPIVAGIRQRGKSMVDGLRNLWRKLVS